ncbi:hypothetical protein Tsubulata_001399 [Turnera subulata]|uniref:S-adenosylmethionine-dependent methyltransferase n=1 Tax=Turnera subulata TaxID=218843 RepID=A0A9Q0FJL2_9ROSI|nr:hypothetical protein Tsubulata_001399 [Turnera subulata]
MANKINEKSSRGSWAMMGGDGSFSYSRNSYYQRAALEAAKGMISEGIRDELDIQTLGSDSPTTFRVVDFGCSTGPNTFFAVKNIIEAVKYKHQPPLKNSPTPENGLEFQIFFNDVTGNDFNTLFKTLPPNPVPYFVAGVPGSFYGRLFPKSTIHFAHSSYAMHWLSEIPKELIDPDSPAWNKGSISYQRSVKEEVVEAFSRQFRNDMDVFLNARAQEIVGGGLMAVVIIGLADGVHTSETGFALLYDLFDSCLSNMARMGVLSEERVDSFNLPVYYPCLKEVEEILIKHPYFSIERMDAFTNPVRCYEPSAEYLVTGWRAVTGDLLKNHFGIGSDAVVDQIYEYFGKKLSDNYYMFDETKQHIDIFILLKRHVD